MTKNRKNMILLLIAAVVLVCLIVLYAAHSHSVKKLLYSQEYTGEDVDVDSFVEKSDKFAIGANEYGKAVFKNPEDALSELKEKYTVGIEVIQQEFDLDDLSDDNYKEYGTYGWQVENGTDEEKEQAAFVSTFMDIYENSFE